MTGDDEIQRGTQRAIGVLTAWLESASGADAALAEEEIRAIIREGPQAQRELVVGLVAAAGTLLDELATATKRTPNEVLRALAPRYYS
jgi:hypothetical protein